MHTDKIEEIHNSLIIGQRRQMADQIKEYGLHDFFPDYKEYLDSYYQLIDRYKYFSDCVISYNRITNR